MGWGPVDWVGRVLPEAKFEEEKMHPVFFNLFDLSDRYRDNCKKTVFGDQLNGLGAS